MARRRRRRRKSGNWFTRLSVGKKIGVCLGGTFLAIAASGVVYAASKLGKLDRQEIPDGDIVVNPRYGHADKHGFGNGLSECGAVRYGFAFRPAG